jgi:hypothetical protein
LVAEAKVENADAALDSATATLNTTLLHLENQKRDSARFKLYFRDAPNMVIRLGLASQLDVVKGWPTALGGETDASLQSLAAGFTTVIAAGTAAIEARAQAVLATATHRAREIVPFVDDLNAARQSLFGELTRLAAGKRPRGWPERFFRATPERDDPPPAG